MAKHICEKCRNVMYIAGKLKDNREVIYCKVCGFRDTYVEAQNNKK